MSERPSPSRPSSASSKVTTVFMVDDHPVICKAVSDTVEDTIGVELCGSAADLGEGFAQIQSLHPDVAIIDISLPDGHGLDLVKSITNNCPTVAVLVFSMYAEDVYAERALRAGASGYLMKTESLDQLVEAIRDVERGETYLSRRMTNRIVRRMGENGSAEARFSIDELTNRELEVFRLLGQGSSVEEIQEELGLTRKTVETHRRRAREKLGLDSITALLQFAMQWTYGENDGMDDEGTKAES